MKTVKEKFEEYQEEAKMWPKDITDDKEMISITTVMIYMEKYAAYIKEQLITPEPTDMTKELLNDIISWEKDLSEYKSLETLLREKYIINKRMTESNISGAFESPEIIEEFIKKNSPDEI